MAPQLALAEWDMADAPAGPPVDRADVLWKRMALEAHAVALNAMARSATGPLRTALESAVGSLDDAVQTLADALAAEIVL